MATPKGCHNIQHSDTRHNDTQQSNKIIQSAKRHSMLIYLRKSVMLVMLTVVYVEYCNKVYYTESYCKDDCLNAECHYGECHYDECFYAECHFAECHYAECLNAECLYAECHNAECYMLSVIC
jgi:hypothetical protein